MEKIFKITLIAMAIIVAIVLLFTDFEEQPNENIVAGNEIEKDTQIDEPEEIGFDHNGLSVKYSHHQISDGNLYVYFEMTNNSSETKSFDYSFHVIGWQEGIELDTNYIYDCEEEKNSGKEIKPGVTILVAEVFEIRNVTEDVTIEFRPFLFWTDKTLYEFEIKLN